MSKFQLDFNIYSSKDRLEAVKKIDLSTLTKTELETVTNYILYGKDSDGTSVVDRKEVEIKTKFNSYKKEKFVSLDEMMESPTFDEGALVRQKTHYKKIKPEIDKEKAKNVPGMIELWKAIDTMAAQLEELKNNSQPSQKDRQRIYYLTHHLISLRKQQYYLMDSQYPTIIGQKNRLEYYDDPINSQSNYPILPRGVMRSINDQEFMNPRLEFYIKQEKEKQGQLYNVVSPEFYSDQDITLLKDSGKPFFDFRIEEHIYQLVQHYAEIQDFVKEMPDSLLNNLLWTLDFYIEKARLSDQQKLIIRDKKLRVPNKEIALHLQKELGIMHQENYISTIWNKVVRLICEAADLNYSEYLCRFYSKAWKKCNRCGKELLRDPRLFVRKAKALDGLTNRCKQCDKDVRQGK